MTKVVFTFDFLEDELSMKLLPLGQMVLETLCKARVSSYIYLMDRLHTSDNQK